MVTPIALAVLALALAWPIPVLLARAAWARRSPGVALVLWQAIAIAGGLSMLGALLAFGLAPFGSDLISGASGLMQDGAPLDRIEILSGFALGSAALLGAHLLLNLALTVMRSERQRRRHEQLVHLLSSPVEDPAGGDLVGARLVDSPAPMAYCLPGALGSITVVSAGLLAVLDPPELRAVIEHERAHASQRHDVVLVLFRAWHVSLPWFPIASLAQHEVSTLLEMLADDRARKSTDGVALARAIAIVGSGQGLSSQEGGFPYPEQVPTRSVHDAAARITRLALAPLPRAAEVMIVAAAAALLVVPTALLFVPAVVALNG